MILVIVSGNLHDLSRQDIHQTLFHQRLIEGVRMVEIEQAPFRLLYLAGGQISVKTVLRDAHHLSLSVVDVYLAQLFHDSLAYRALSAGGAPRHADQKGCLGVQTIEFPVQLGITHFHAFTYASNNQ
jgi:hypothetical protein